MLNKYPYSSHNTQRTDLGLDDGARAAPLGVAGPADGEEREEVDVAARF